GRRLAHGHVFPAGVTDDRELPLIEVRDARGPVAVGADEQQHALAAPELRTALHPRGVSADAPAEHAHGECGDAVALEHLVDVDGHVGVDASTIGVARDRGDATVAALATVQRSTMIDAPAQRPSASTARAVTACRPGASRSGDASYVASTSTHVSARSPST